jgi:hypothetical protein
MTDEYMPHADDCNCAEDESKKPSDDYLFKGKPLKEKIITGLLLPPVLLFTFYLTIRIALDPTYKEKLRNPTENEDPNPLPGDDATEDEWDAYYREEFRQQEEWDKKHRVFNVFTMFVGALFMFVFTIIEWFQKLNTKRKK